MRAGTADASWLQGSEPYRVEQAIPRKAPKREVRRQVQCACAVARPRGKVLTAAGGQSEVMLSMWTGATEVDRYSASTNAAGRC